MVPDLRLVKPLVDELEEPGSIMFHSHLWSFVNCAFLCIFSINSIVFNSQ